MTNALASLGAVLLIMATVPTPDQASPDLAGPLQEPTTSAAQKHPPFSPNTGPFRTELKLLGNPIQGAAIDVMGVFDLPANTTSLQVWSPDGAMGVAANNSALRGLDLLDRTLHERFWITPPSEAVSELRVSVEVEAPGYGMNADYRLLVIDTTSFASASGTLESTVSEAAGAVLGSNHSYPRWPEQLHAWGQYLTIVDEMNERCCNASRMVDPPFNNDLPPTFNPSTGDPPNASMEEATRLPSELLTDLAIEDVVPTRVSNTTGGVSIAMSGVTVYGFLDLKEPDTTEAHPCAYCKIEIWDSDGSFQEYVLSATTAFDGYFQEVMPYRDGDNHNDPYLVTYLENTFMDVQKANGGTFRFSPGKAMYLNCPTTTCNLGVVEIHSAYPVGSHGYEEVPAYWDPAAMAYYWTTVSHDRIHGIGPSGSEYYVNEFATIRLPTDNIAGEQEIDGTPWGPHYHPGGEIHFDVPSALAPSVVSHEYGHLLMYDMYGDSWPGGTWCPSPHYWNAAHSEACAWREGWANFWGVLGLAAVRTAPERTRLASGSGSYFDIEDYSNNFGGTFADGAAVEGRVAGTLWDLIDAPTDDNQEWVDYSVGGTVVPVMREGPQSIIRDYYDDWVASPNARSSSNFKAAAEFNTIDTSGWP